MRRPARNRLFCAAQPPCDHHLQAATLLLAQGVDQRVVMEILGHSQISMTSRYAHVLPQVMTDAAERIGRALWGEA